MRRMTAALSGFVIVTGCALAAQQHDAHKAGGGTANAQAKIRDAMSAAPSDISKNATVVDFPDKPGGQMKELRKGSNGWTCMPSTGTGGGVGADPMCLDKTW